MSLFALLAAAVVQSAVTNGVEVRWFEDRMPAPDGVKLYTYGVAPKEGVKCPIVKGEQARIVTPRVAHNRVFAAESELVLHAL